MSKEDIEKAVQEAAQYESEDKKRREEVDIRNNADQMIYQTEKTVGEFGDKLSDEEKGKIETAKEALKEALKGTDIEAIKAASEGLQKEIYAVSEKVYKAAAEAQQAAGQNGNPAGGADNVYDADFSDVDDKN
jgi:molecular chaperone DnaK